MLVIATIVRDSIIKFCMEFLDEPYLCYTEHGQHASFYNLLLNSLPINQRYIFVNNHKVCTIQKEYPTASKLFKPRRQHWDVAVIELNQSSNCGYDYLKLNTVVEFGLNEGVKHLRDDINRLKHPDSNVVNKFIVHLYRISGKGNSRVSGRDWSAESRQIVKIDEVYEQVKQCDVQVFYGIYDSTGKLNNGLWEISSVGITKIK